MLVAQLPFSVTTFTFNACRRCNREVNAPVQSSTINNP